MCIIAFNYLWLYINTQEVYSYTFVTLHTDRSAPTQCGRVFRHRYLNHGYLLIYCLLSQPRPRREPRHSASFKNIKRHTMGFFSGSILLLILILILFVLFIIIIIIMATRSRSTSSSGSSSGSLSGYSLFSCHLTIGKYLFIIAHLCN